jgi:hypothetical protein
MSQNYIASSEDSIGRDADWRATMTAPQSYAHWELKLKNARGVIRHDKIEPEHQNPREVQMCMRKLRDEN